MSIRSTAVAALAATSVVANAWSLDSRDDSCANKLKLNYTAPVAAKGWSYRLATNGFKKPRSIAFDDNGGLLVVDSGVGVYRLTIDTDNGDSCVTMSSPKKIIDSKELNHGLALSDDGKMLYASSSSNVYAWTYDSKAGTVGESNFTVVRNMSDTDKTTRTLLMSRKKTGMLIVSRGTTKDDDQDAKKNTTGHAQLRAFDVGSKKNSSEAYSFLDGQLLGWGLRNSVGVAEDPAKGGIWSVENSIDELTRDGKDIHADNPGEELNYHGSLNESSTSKSQGGNYGFPFCYTLWNDTNFPDQESLKPGEQFPGPEAKTFSDETCNKDYVAPRLALQAHVAPLDIKFNTDGSKAYISYHGSWARENPVGYKIVSIAFNTDKGEPTADKSSTDAAVDILSAPNLNECPDGCARPVGLAWDAKGRLWFSSDNTGEIFVMTQNGTEQSDGSLGSRSVVADRAATWAVVLAAVVAGLFLA